MEPKQVYVIDGKLYCLDDGKYVPCPINTGTVVGGGGGGGISRNRVISLINQFGGNISASISVGGAPNILVASVSGGTAPYTYLWSVNTNRSNTDFFIGV